MRLKNCLRLLTAIAGVATLATSATAYGAATPGTFYIPVSSHETGLTGDCFGGVNGTLDGTSVFSGHNVVTPSGFGSLHGTEVSQVRIVYDNGITFVGGSTDHFAVEQTTSTGTGVHVYTITHADSGTTYAADGSVLGIETAHATDHVTITGDTVRVEFSKFRLTC